MKWVQILLLGLLIGFGATATAQQRVVALNGQDRLRLRDLKLTAEQKRKIAIMVRRERVQYYLNQKELNTILTEEQKAMLVNWRNKRTRNNADSTTVNK